MVDQKVLNDKKLPKIEKIALLNDELRKKLITGELFKADSKATKHILLKELVYLQMV